MSHMDRVSHAVDQVILDHSQPMTLQRAKALGASMADGGSTPSSLILRSCAIGPTTCAAMSTGISASVFLLHVDLGSNPISDTGASALGEALGHSVSLTRLSLASCQIGTAGCAAVSEGVQKSRTLRDLDMSDNCCVQQHVMPSSLLASGGGGGVVYNLKACCSLSAALRGSSTLTKLNLSLCGITGTSC